MFAMSDDGESAPARDAFCGLAIFAALRTARRRMAASATTTTTGVATTTKVTDTLHACCLPLVRVVGGMLCLLSVS